MVKLYLNKAIVGDEVKAGQPPKVQHNLGKLIHISHVKAALVEVKDVKGAKIFPLNKKIDIKNYVIGALSAEDRPQLMFNLVFEGEFELSHDWKSGSAECPKKRPSESATETSVPVKKAKSAAADETAPAAPIRSPAQEAATAVVALFHQVDKDGIYQMIRSLQQTLPPFGPGSILFWRLTLGQRYVSRAYGEVARRLDICADVLNS
ncbi:Hypothetical predicted protein [Olea europaea subsp. europaea]|uniref:Uncharacterized protein n=1 Tax=Olea europaea subsp. europaea TaxID=158383 RepID=A0A8S0VK17_OLEEU|nr:Hypothetical predicted protein [Olea europaea subsp. europaea]